jgi:hypothetical protein
MAGRIETPIDGTLRRRTISVRIDPHEPELQHVYREGRRIGTTPRLLHRIYPALFWEKVRRWIKT